MNDTTKPAAALSEEEFDAMRAAIIAKLRDHRMVNMFEQEDGFLGNSYPLIDRLSVDDCDAITSALPEIEAIAESVIDSIEEQILSIIAKRIHDRACTCMKCLAEFEAEREAMLAAPAAPKASAVPEAPQPNHPLTTLLTASGARRHVLCWDGSGEPFDAYDTVIADRVVHNLKAEIYRLELRVEALGGCNMCGDYGTVGFPPDDYYPCPKCTQPVAAAPQAEEEAVTPHMRKTYYMLRNEYEALVSDIDAKLTQAREEGFNCMGRSANTWFEEAGKWESRCLAAEEKLASIRAELDKE